jgi:hypothetical protein
MDIANPKDFLRALESAKATTIHIETEVIRRALREAVAQELEALAPRETEISQKGVRIFLLTRARDIRAGGR